MMKTNPALRFASRNRATTAAALAAPLLLTGLLIAGCGSGGDSSPSPIASASTVDTLGAARDVQTGQVALNGLLASNDMPSASALQTVSASFASAHAKNPNNTQASVLLGLTQIASAAQDVADAAAPLGDSRASIPFAYLSQFQLKNWGGLRSSLIGTGKTRAALLASPLLLAHAGQMSKGRATVDSVRLRASLENLRTVIGNSLPLIQQGADDPSFSFGLTDFITNTPNERVLDRADIAVMVSALYETRAGLSLALAYDTNVGSTDFAQTIAARFTTINSGDTITPDEYLPALPLGTLTNDGKSDFASAKTDTATGADKGLTALTYLQGRTGSQLHLIDSADLTNQDYLTAKLALTGLKASLNGPSTVPLGGSGKSVTLNLKAWFDNPPNSLRTFFPTYTVGTDSSGAPVLQATAASYPDLTFGGLIPSTSGIPADALNTTIPTNKTLGDLLSGFLGGLENLDL